MLYRAEGFSWLQALCCKGGGSQSISVGWGVKDDTNVAVGNSCPLQTCRGTFLTQAVLIGGPIWCCKVNFCEGGIEYRGWGGERVEKIGFPLCRSYCTNEQGKWCLTWRETFSAGNTSFLRPSRGFPLIAKMFLSYLSWNFLPEFSMGFGAFTDLLDSPSLQGKWDVNIFHSREN